MKNKNLAIFLALFTGWFGGHRYYVGNIGKAIFYTIFALTGIPFMISIIDAIVWLSMSENEFQDKYGERHKHKDKKEQNSPQYSKSYVIPFSKKAKKIKFLLQDGIKAYKEYDMVRALKNFEKALILNETKGVHYNLACCYSHLENLPKAFYHLEKAVKLGFNDFEKINKANGLAYLRAQDDFDIFVENGYKIKDIKLIDESKNEDLLSISNILEELRNEGILSEVEYLRQKQNLTL